MERTRRLDRARVGANCGKCLRVRTGVWVAWCWYVASHERAKTVKQEGMHKFFWERWEERDAPLELVGKVACARGWMETADKENARHF